MKIDFADIDAGDRNKIAAGSEAAAGRNESASKGDKQRNAQNQTRAAL